MTTIKRINTIILSILLIIGAFIIMFIVPDVACQLILGILMLSLTIAGLRRIVYYFSMARHMVSGQLILYEGIIMFDFGMFTGMLNRVPETFMMLYLVVYGLFAGALSILNAWELKKHNGSWKGRLTGGIVCILLAIACIIFRSSVDVMVTIYCFGLIYYAISKIVEALKPTAIVYIQ